MNFWITAVLQCYYTNCLVYVIYEFYTTVKTESTDFKKTELFPLKASPYTVHPQVWPPAPAEGVM